MSSDVPAGWTFKPLEAICHRVSVGYVGETSSAFTSGDGVPLIRSQNVRPGRVDVSEIRHVTQSFHEQNRKSQLRAGDLLIVRVGQNRGDCAVLPEGFGEVNCANIVFARPKESYCDFLGAYFNTLRGREQLLSLSSGSAQLVLNTTAVAKTLVPVPPDGEAREVGMLSRQVNDRIALLRETNATLEAIAQALFKSWFVDFDPVRAKQQGLAPPGMDEATAALFPDSFEESALGLVPKGWSVQPVGDAVECVGGATPDTKDPS
jgi:type I restriction enzyme S subunit